MAPIHPTNDTTPIGGAGQVNDSDLEQRRRKERGALQMAAVAARKKKLEQRAKQHLKRKRRAHGPIAPVFDNNKLAGSNEEYYQALQDVQARHNEELAHLRRLHQQDQHLKGEHLRLPSPPHALASATAAHAGASADPDPDPDLDTPIPVPNRCSDITVEYIRRACGLEGREHNKEWNRMNTAMREFMCRAGFNWNLSWKQQDTVQVSILCASINEKFHRLGRFQNGWATPLLVQDKFNNHKWYEKRRLREGNAEPHPNPRPRRQARIASADSLDGLATIKQSPASSPQPEQPGPALGVEPDTPVSSPKPSTVAPSASPVPSRRPRPRMRPPPPPSNPTSPPSSAQAIPTSTPASASPTQPANSRTMSREPSSMSVELSHHVSSGGKSSHAQDADQTPPASEPTLPPMNSPSRMSMAPPTRPPTISPAHPLTVVPANNSTAPLEPEPAPKSVPAPAPQPPRYLLRGRNLTAASAAEQTAAAVAAQQKKQQRVVQKAGSGSGKSTKGVVKGKAVKTATSGKGTKAAASAKRKRVTASAKGKEKARTPDKLSEAERSSVSSDNTEDDSLMASSGQDSGSDEED